MVGSYPPAPGPAAAATVAAVRRAWADGQEVVVVSPRPSAALLVMPVAGAEVGPALSKLRRPPGPGATGSGPGCDEVVVCMEPGWPLGRGRRPAPGRPMTGDELERAARSLASALSGFQPGATGGYRRPWLARSRAGPVVAVGRKGHGQF